MLCAPGNPEYVLGRRRRYDGPVPRSRRSRRLSYGSPLLTGIPSPPQVIYSDVGTGVTSTYVDCTYSCQHCGAKFGYGEGFAQTLGDVEFNTISVVEVGSGFLTKGETDDEIPDGNHEVTKAILDGHIG